MGILIAVEGCVAHADRWEVIKETWASRHPHAVLDIHFFTGTELNVPDDYLSLPLKTRAICKWSLDHGYDQTMIVDTDTYLSLPRALASGFEKHDYMGFVQTWLAAPYCSGPSYWLSRKACEVLAVTNWKQYEIEGHATDEDVMVGSVLFHRGIRYCHDERYVRPEGVRPDNDIISEHLTYHKPYTHEAMYEAHRRALGG